MEKGSWARYNIMEDLVGANEEVARSFLSLFPES